MKKTFPNEKTSPRWICDQLTFQSVPWFKTFPLAPCSRGTRKVPQARLRWPIQSMTLDTYHIISKLSKTFDFRCERYEGSNICQSYELITNVKRTKPDASAAASCCSSCPWSCLMRSVYYLYIYPVAVHKPLRNWKKAFDPWDQYNWCLVFAFRHRQITTPIPSFRVYPQRVIP